MNPREITRTNLAFENDLAIPARHKPAGFFTPKDRDDWLNDQIPNQSNNELN